MFKVHVANIGTVYEGDANEAVQIYSEYVHKSQMQEGRASSEDVYLFRDDDLIREFNYYEWLNSEYDSGLRRTYGF